MAMGNLQLGSGIGTCRAMYRHQPPATGQLTEAGCMGLPAAPGFYHRPKRIDQLVDFVVQRVLDRLGLDIEVADRWTGDTSIC